MFLIIKFIDILWEKKLVEWDCCVKIGKKLFYVLINKSIWYCVFFFVKFKSVGKIWILCFIVVLV